MRLRLPAISPSRLAAAAAALAGAGALLAAADRVLARRIAGPGGLPAIVSVRTVAAPPETAWSVLADLEGQVRWMHDARAIRVLSPGPHGVGTVAEADVRIFGLGTTDRIAVTAWEPPRRFAIGHVGTFRGDGEFVLESVAGGTRVRWEERLVSPLLPALFALLGRPILGRVFQADLDRFARLVESSTAGGAAEDA